MLAGALLAALLSMAGSAAAAVTTPGMIVTAFHNRDFVTVEGPAAGSDITVDVVRDGVTIGTTGPAKMPAGGALEVNHGPAGTPVPGDCWLNTTPDIRPQDVIRVTTAGAVDTMTVAGVDVTGKAFLLDNGDVAVEGTAAAADGSRLAPASFEVGLRNQRPRFRRDPLPPPGAVYQGETGNTWRAVYQPDGVRQNGDDAAFTVEQQRDMALNSASWRALSPAGGAGSELTISENDAVNGPGAGCPAPADPNAITSGYAPPVNLTSGDITIGGTAKEGTTAVSVTVKDGAGTALPAKDATLSTNATGPKTWSVPVSRADLGTLADGSLTVAAAFTDAAGATVNGAPRALLKDTVAPDVPNSTPAAGTYSTAQSVSLGLPAGESPLSEIRYTVNGFAPTPTSTKYTAQISVTASQNIRAIVVDPAGNASPIRDFPFTIKTAPPPAPVATPAAGTYGADQSVTLDAEPGATFRYTTNGTTPTATTGTPWAPGDAPIAVTAAAGTERTTTVKALAIDTAGTASAVATLVYTIDKEAPAEPVPTPAGGTYTSARTVSMTAEPGATIRYTRGLNNTTDPTPTSGTRYTAPFSISSTATVRAIAIDVAGNVSPVAVDTYTIQTDVTPPPAPTVNPAGGTYATAQSVTMSDAEAGAIIRYTTDGTTPTATNGIVYSGPIAVTTSQVITAAAFDAASNRSTVVTRTYAIDTTPPPDPTVTPAGGTYTSAQAVTMAVAEAGATIRYTVGSGTTIPADPTRTSGTVYSGTPINVGTSRVIKVAAFDAAGNRSIKVAQHDYVINTDTAKPTVTARTPAANAMTVAAGTNVTATFSEAVTGVSTTSATLQPVSSTGTLGTAVDASVSYNATTRVATLNPTANLTADTKYTATLTSGIKDGAGNTLATTTWSFTTGPAPTLSGRTPAVNGTSFAVANNVTATFNEAVSGVGGTTFRLQPVTSTGGLGTAVGATVSYNATTRVATLNPTADLTADTRYTVTLTNAIKDGAGNPLANTTWTFTTGPAPTVSARTPASGATAVSRTANVTATFSEAVSTVGATTFTLKDAATGAAITATVSRNGTSNQWILDPSVTLAANTRFTATLTGGASGIKDLAGNPLSTSTWSFTTGA